MPPLFLVMIGGAIGAGFRYHVGRIALERLGPNFPWGTWIVNLVGGLLMGVLVGVLVTMTEGREQLRLFLGVGVLGGFTTFSAFSLETFTLLSRGDYALATGYVASSVAGAVMMVAIGIWIMRIVG